MIEAAKIAIIFFFLKTKNMLFVRSIAIKEQAKNVMF